MATRTGNGAPADHVILVDENDRPVGSAPKLDAHRNGGALHRAFSIFVFNSAGEMLLQRRAATKYHFGTLWTNACCSHPRHGQTLEESAHARLRHEFGFDAPLQELFSFVYRAEDPASGLTEHEFDHVFFGQFNGTPHPNPAEIDEWRWSDPDDLAADVRAHPDRYTPWFRIALDEVMRRRARAK